jgi:hypothetical protein
MNVECRFPSPTWPKVAIVMLLRFAISCMPSIASGIRLGGTPKSSAIGMRREPG